MPPAPSRSLAVPRLHALAGTALRGGLMLLASALLLLLSDLAPLGYGP